MLTLLSPVPTPWHRLPAWGKLLALSLFTLALFQLQAIAWAAGALALVLALYLVAGWRFLRHGLRVLRPMLAFVIVALLWHLWLGQPVQGGLVALRLLAALMAANLVTMTTRLSDIIALIERLAAPLRPLGLQPERLALAVALVLRFIPVMAERLAQLIEAWRARSPRRAGWRLAFPATLAALDDAEQVAEALRARGGSG